jgi:hypothetical protein
VSANVASGSTKAGKIDIVSTEGALTCVAASIVRANDVAGGGGGGNITMRSLNHVTYNCSVQAIGNFVSGKGGTILLQAFGPGGGTVFGSGPVSALGPNGAPGSITLRAGGDHRWELHPVIVAVGFVFGDRDVAPNMPQPPPGGVVRAKRHPALRPRKIYARERKVETSPARGAHPTLTIRTGPDPGDRRAPANSPAQTWCTCCRRSSAR